jgi:hypothetical protein
MPDSSDSQVNAANLTITALMQNVSSLNVNGLREHTISPTTNMTGVPYLSQWLSSCYKFKDGTVDVTVYDATNAKTSCTYNFTGDNGRIIGIPEDVDKTREAWTSITSNVSSTTQGSDSYIQLKAGSYIQIGTDILRCNEDVKIDNVGNFDALSTSISEKLKLETGQSISSQVYIKLSKDTQLAVGSSVATLDKNVIITIDGIDDDALSGTLSALYNANGAYATAQNLITLFDSLVGAVDDSDSVDVTFDFWKLN